MKKLLVSLFILTLLCIVLLPFGNVEARQGCCSHHGGVCGCRCCDGTPLSAKCAPYYPQCNTRSIPEYQPPKNEPSTPKYDSPSPQSLVAEVPKESGNGSIWWWIIGIGVVSYLFYRFKKRKKQTS